MAFGVALAAQAAHAEDRKPKPKEAEFSTVDDVIVTGTRDYNVKARESTAPVTVISAAKLEQTGQSNLLGALQRLNPSYSFSGFGGDLNNLVRSPRLRGLSTNHVLVLVNGKRRHGTANLSSTTFTKGSAGADLELIPVATVDHIEILEDGAAAQYGSDAIAGVINVILKNSPDSGSVSALIGSYGASYNANTHGNGLTRNLQVDKGVGWGEQGFLHLGADLTSHLHSNQNGSDRNIYSPLPRVGPGTPFPWLNPDTVGGIIGDPAYILGAAGFNAGYRFDNGVEVYAFGTGAGRRAESFQNFRTPTINGGAVRNRVPQILSFYGFLPAETIHESDWAVTGGVKGSFLDDGRWDLSFTYGADEIDVGINDTANASLFNDTGWTPYQFYIGQYSNSQRTINLDFTKPISLGFLPAPVNVAFGAENRHETYKIVQGDFWSYYKGGPAAWVGIRPSDAGNHSREAFAGYIDVSTKPLPEWKVNIAGRYETYSDFGDTVNGKLSTRYDFSPQIGVRGTVSTGFRAPTLGEEFFSQSTVTPISANFVLPANSSAASIAGAQPLKPEKSTNITVGVVTELLPRLHASIDAYQIDLRDRIVSTGSLSGPTALKAIEAAGGSVSQGAQTFNGFVSFFVNGANTRTRGVDLKADYSIDVGDDGAFRFDFAASFFETTILSVRDAPPAFNGAPLLDAVARANITQNVPHAKIIWGGSYLRDAWTFTLHFTQYGYVSSVSAWALTGGAPYTTSVISPKLITDLEIGYDFDFGLHAAIGGNNVFGVRPDVAPFPARFFNANVFSNFAPFGINGGYYYARASWKF